MADFLAVAWTRQFGRSPTTLVSDLSDLQQYFAPTATGRRLREAVAKLPRSDYAASLSPPEEIYLESSNGRGLVTPEGRVLLHVLQLHRDEDPVAISTAEVAWSYRVVADLYREWSRHRLLEALGIKEGALRLPVIGLNLTLLVNGSIGRERAMPVPANEQREQDLSSILGPIVDAFVDALKPSRQRTESFRLRGGWALTETTRHLFRFVGSAEEGVWIQPGQASALVHRLGRELARDRKRTSSDVEAAFGKLVEGYRRHRPALAARGLAYERSANTAAVREGLISSFARVRGES